MGMLNLHDAITLEALSEWRIPFILQYEKGEVWKVVWLQGFEFKRMLYMQYTLAACYGTQAGFLLDCDSDVALLKASKDFCKELWYSKTSDLFDQWEGNGSSIMSNDFWSFTYEGLIPVMVQDFHSGDILMFAWTNKEAWTISLSEGTTCFYSRSRKKLWRKGEKSGHRQIIKGCSVYVSTDSKRRLPPTLLYSVEQTGCACHEGYRSCFYRRIYPFAIALEGKRIMDPGTIYKKEDEQSNF